jgi:1-aminocyclopropane-1-carboxylate deaminase/D-cysteine desulfhydrase-like pyridoxal-dependent ACC family enzyme
MEIQFIPGESFRNREALLSYAAKAYHTSYVVNEGGRSDRGIEGASEILDLVDAGKYNHVCCSIGTATMMAGIINASPKKQQILGFSSLKISERRNEISSFLEEKTYPKKNYEIIYDYHFGGYARYNQQLIDFMNDFYSKTQIPTDFVYTGKLLYGVMNLAQSNLFAPGSNILVIHSGGLQGNCSLARATLLF